MVSLNTGAFRGRTMRKLFPGHHALADMDAPVIGNAGFNNIIATGFI